MVLPDDEVRDRRVTGRWFERVGDVPARYRPFLSRPLRIIRGLLVLARIVAQTVARSVCKLVLATLLAAAGAVFLHLIIPPGAWPVVVMVGLLFWAYDLLNEVSGRIASARPTAPGCGLRCPHAAPERGAPAP